ncbi:MAG: PAS-domain containing protein [Pseudomonadota bacterium]
MSKGTRPGQAMMIDGSTQWLDAEDMALVFDSLDCLRVAVTVFDEHDTLRYANQHYQYLFPSLQSAGPLIGRSFQDLCGVQITNGDIAGPEVLDDPDAWVYSWRTQRRIRDAVPRILRLFDGRWIEVKDRPTPRNAVISFYSDVTDLMQSRLRLEDAVSVSADGFAFWDQAGRLVTANALFAEVATGRPGGALPGVSYADVMRRLETRIARRETLANDQRSSSDEALHATRDLIEMHDKRAFRLIEQRTRDGGLMTILSDVSEEVQRQRLLKKRGTYLRDTVFMLKQSQSRIEEQTREMLRMSDDLNRAESRAAHADGMRASLLRNISHELRTPLNAIIGFSEILSNEMLGPIGTPNYCEYASMIHESGVGLLHSVNQILEMAQIEGGELTVSPSDDDAVEWVRDTVTRFARQAEEAGRALMIDAPDTPYPALLDRDVLDTILGNVVSNAIKYSDEGGTVTATVNLDTDFFDVFIQDEGPGIPKRVLEDLDGTFVRGEDVYTATAGGVGLGLPIARVLARLHGAQLTFEPLEVGTLARLRVPRQPALAPKTGDHGPAEATADQASRQSAGEHSA